MMESPANTIQVVSGSALLSKDVEAVPEGLTLAQMLTRVGILEPLWPLCQVYLDGQPIQREWWPRVKPKAGPGRVINVALWPAAGADFDSADLRVASSILVLVAANVIPGALGLSGLAGGLVTSLLGIGGLLAINNLIPPPDRDVADGVFSVTGTRNQLHLDQAIPKLYGKMRIYPPMAAVPYTEIEGAEQYLNLLFLLGHGPIRVHDIRIGETDIADINDVLVQVSEGWPDQPTTFADGDTYDGDPDTAPQYNTPITLYSRDIHEEIVNQTLTHEPDFEDPPGAQLPGVARRTTLENTDRISLDFVFPGGLGERATDGRVKFRTVQLRAEYRPHDSTLPWRALIPADPMRDNRLDYSTWSQSKTCNRIDQVQNDIRTTLATIVALDNTEKQITLKAQRALAGRLDVISQELAEVQCDDVATPTLRADLFVDLRGIRSEWANWTLRLLPVFTTPSDAFDAALEALNLDIEAMDALLDIELMVERAYPIRMILHSEPVARWAILEPLLTYLTTPPRPDLSFIQTITIKDRKMELVRRSFSTLLLTGQYDVRVRRVTPDKLESDTEVQDEVRWSVLRSIKNRPPVNRTDVALVAVRVKATDQVSSVLARFNMLCSAPLQNWNGSKWKLHADNAATNPAWSFADVIRGAGAKKTLPDAQIDTAALLTWATDNGASGFQFSAYYTRDITQQQALQDITAVAKASPSLRDGLVSVVQDKVRTTPVQVFTPRNSRNFKAHKTFLDPVHAIRARFVNEESNYQIDQMIVYADGFAQVAGWQSDPFGQDSDHAEATNFEDMDFFGVVDTPNSRGQTWKLARYFLAASLLRPEVFELGVDWENLICERGDLVLVNHDLTLWGLGAARVVSVVMSGGDIDTATLDADVTMEGGKSYKASIRTTDGLVYTGALVLNVGTSPTIDFSPDLDVGSSVPAKGDLLIWGEATTVSVECVVKAIAPAADQGAKLTLVEHAPAVHTAETGLIPPFNPQITFPADPTLIRPPRPKVDAVLTGDAALRLLSNRAVESAIVLILRPPVARSVAEQRVISEIDAVIVEYRERIDNILDAVDAVAQDTSGTTEVARGDWIRIGVYSKDLTTIRIPQVQDQDFYELRLRYGAAGIQGDWTLVGDLEVQGQLTTPPTPTQLSIEGDQLNWVFRTSSPDHAGFLVRFVYGQGDLGWGDAPSTAIGVQRHQSWTIPKFNNQTVTFFVKSVTTSGVESAVAAELTKAYPLDTTDNRGGVLAPSMIPGDQSVNGVGPPWESWRRDIGGLGHDFPLQPASVNNLEWADPLFGDALHFYGPEASVDTELYWDFQSEASYIEVEYTPAGAEIGARLWLLGNMTTIEDRSQFHVEYGIGLADLWPETDSEPIWPETDGENFWPVGPPSYRAFPGRVRIIDDVYFLRIRNSRAKGHAMETANFLFTVQVDEKVEQFSNMTVANSGTVRLPIALTYEVGIFEVVPVIRQDGGHTSAMTVEVVDRQSTPIPDGPEVQVFDSGHARVSGKIDATVLGY